MRWTATTARRMATAVATRRPRGVVLCADFDETMTQRDTIRLLFRLAERAAASPAQHAAVTQRLVARYSSDMAAFLDSQSSEREEDRDGQRPSGLDAFLEGFAATDRRSIERVRESKALKGIAMEEIQRAGRSVEVRDGCASVLATANELHVVSSNWSGEMIRAALGDVAGLIPGRVSVCANELVTDEGGVTTGDIAMTVQSPADKAQAVRRIRLAHEQATAHESSGVVVFVGDGVNDILAMLEADVGISLEETKLQPSSTRSLATLHGVATRYGIATEPLGRFASLSECADAVAAARENDSRVIFAANSWTDIARLIPQQRPR